MDTRQLILNQVEALKAAYEKLEKGPDEDEMDFLGKRTKVLAQIVRVEKMLDTKKKKEDADTGEDVEEPEGTEEEIDKTSVRSLIRNLGGDSAMQTVATIKDKSKVI